MYAYIVTTRKGTEGMEVTAPPRRFGTREDAVGMLRARGYRPKGKAKRPSRFERIEDGMSKTVELVDLEDGRARERYDALRIASRMTDRDDISE